ncbi:hypothetical protein MJ581_12300 [Escherichia coli]|nr:hypothetical protein MJ581_12300 [Escherichia coli]
MSSMTTTDNKAFLNELARLVGSSHLLTDPAKRPAIARASVLVRAMHWLSFSLAHYWNCGGC